MYEQSRVSQDVSVIASAWWVAFLLGLLSIAAGVIVIVKPSNSLQTLAVVSGIFILADGIIAIAGAFGDTRNAGMVAILGVLSVVVGILLIRHPIGGVKAVAFLLGIWLIAAAVVRAVLAIAVPGNRLGRALVAAVLGIAGIVIVSEPHIGYATLAVIVGIGFIAYGATTVVLGLALRTVGDAAAAGAHHGAVAT